MPQTLFAVIAVLVFSIYGLTLHTNLASAERRAVGGELDRAAGDLASARLAAVVALAFDEADARDGAPLRTSTSGLTAPADLGPDAGEGTPARYDDLDDYEGFEADEVVAFEGRPLQFRLAVEVRYVEPTDPEVSAGSRTLAKEVVVTAVEVAPPANRAPARVTLRRALTAAEQFLHR